MAPTSTSATTGSWINCEYACRNSAVAKAALPRGSAAAVGCLEGGQDIVFAPLYPRNRRGWSSAVAQHEDVEAMLIDGGRTKTHTQIKPALQRRERAGGAQQ